MKKIIKFIVLAFIFWLCVFSTNALIVDTNLVMRLPLTADEDDVLLNYGWDNNGVSFDGTWGTFDGGDYLNSNPIFDLTLPFTLCYTIEPIQITETGGFYKSDTTFGQNFVLWNSGGGTNKPEGHGWDATPLDINTYTNPSLANGVEYAICLVMTSLNASIWIDGVSQINDTQSITLDNDNTLNIIGEFAGTEFNLKMKEVCLWEQELSDTELLEYTSSQSCYGSISANLIINHNLIDETNVEEIVLNETIIYNGTMTATTDFFNCSLWTNRNNVTTLNETQLNVNLTTLQVFNYDYGFIDDNMFFRINCSNFETSDDTGWFSYSVDTTKYLNYLIGIDNLSNTNSIWGEINMIWIILFIALFFFVGIITRIFGLWVFSGFGFFLLSFRVTLENTPYSMAVAIGGVIMGLLVMLFGVIAQILIIVDDKKKSKKPSVFDDVNY